MIGRVMLVGVLAALGLWLSACASTGSTHHRKGEPCRVDLYQGRTGGHLSVVNAEYAKSVPERERGQQMSVIDDETMSELMKFLEDQGYFARATKGASGAGASDDFIAVAARDGVWVAQRPIVGDSWKGMVIAIAGSYNVGNTMVGETSRNKPTIDFEEQDRRQREANQRRMQELRNRSAGRRP